jgi:hypothetical protein
MHLPIVNCHDSGWGFRLVLHLQKHQEVDLINVDFGAHRAAFEGFATRFGMSMEHETESKTVRFRRPRSA